MNTKYLTIFQPVTVQLPVSVSLIDNSKRIHMYGKLIFYFETSPLKDVCISLYGVQLCLGFGKNVY